MEKETKPTEEFLKIPVSWANDGEDEIHILEFEMREEFERQLDALIDKYLMV